VRSRTCVADRKTPSRAGAPRQEANLPSRVTYLNSAPAVTGPCLVENALPGRVRLDRAGSQADVQVIPMKKIFDHFQG
jgi:hypothetical protein